MTTQPHAYWPDAAAMHQPMKGPGSTTTPVSEFMQKQLELYREHLSRKWLSLHTRRAYISRTSQFVRFLIGQPEYCQIRADSVSSILAAEHFQQYLLAQAPRSPHSTNAILSAVEQFFKFIGLPELNLDRQVAPAHLPRVLTSNEERKYLQTVRHHASAKERALIVTLIYTGIRIGECADLSACDVDISANAGSITVRGKYARSVPLNSVTRDSLRDWLDDRAKLYFCTPAHALFLNRQGKSISTRGIDHIVRKLGFAARLAVSADVLRQTCLTKVASSSRDPHVVAAIAGYKSLRSAERYCLVDPCRDLLQAVESLVESNCWF